MDQHLIKCSKYLGILASKGVENDISRQASAEAKQTQLIIPKISSANKALLDLDFANACYVAGLPFTIYEGEEMKNAFHRLNPAYKPPNRQALAGPLLELAFMQLKDKVDQIVSSTQLLNIVTDESTNINSARIVNISVHTPAGAFHWRSEDIGTRQMTAVNVAEWIKNHLSTLCNGHFDRINSIATDTCPTMLKTWETLQEFQDFKHCFFIPCDSHGRSE